MRRCFSKVSLIAILWWMAVASLKADTVLTYAPVGGLVMARDQLTLIVSVTSKGKLVYIDTLTEKEAKQVDVDFQPTFLAVQGKHLFAVAKGTTKIFVLDVDTAKVVKEIKLPGEPLVSMNCHSEKGLLYAVNANDEVYSINPETGKTNKTKARGQMLIADAADGQFVYTGIQKPIRDVLVIESRGDKVKVSLAQAGTQAFMMKFKVDGTDLIPVAVNKNAATNGRAMAVTKDGKQVAMAGGGGWRSGKDPKANYAIAVFESDKMEGLNGQVDTGPYPNNIAFHPVLNLGAAYNTKEVILFNAKSFVKKDSFQATESSFNHPGYLLFGGKGTKIIYCSYNAPIQKDSLLHIFTLPLTPDEQAQLKKAGEEKK